MVWLAMNAPAAGPEGGQVKVPGVALVGDEKAGLVNDQRRGRVGLGNEPPERIVQLLNVLLDQLGQSRHVMRIVERFR